MMATTCSFSSFLQKGKTCPHSAQGNSGLCIWHDPDVPKNVDTIKEQLKSVIESTERDLEGFLLRRADLSGLNLRDVNLKDADLREANLDGAVLCGADLRGAKMDRVSATGADFEGANLMAASLAYGNFSDSNFKGVNFRIVHVSYANFAGCDFSGSDRRHTELFSVDSLSSSEMATSVSSTSSQTLRSVTPPPSSLSAEEIVSDSESKENVDVLFDDTELLEEMSNLSGIEDSADTAILEQTLTSSESVSSTKQSLEQGVQRYQATDELNVPSALMSQSISRSNNKIFLMTAIIAAAVFLLIAILGVTIIVVSSDKHSNSAQTVPTQNSVVVQKPVPIQPSIPSLKETVIEPTKVIAQKQDKPVSQKLEERLKDIQLKETKKKQDNLSLKLQESNKKMIAIQNKMSENENKLTSTISGLTSQLETAVAQQKKLEKQLQDAYVKIDMLRKRMTDKKDEMNARIEKLLTQLRQTEKAVNDSKGGKAQFAEIVTQLRETNDGLMADYERKIADYKAQIARLSQWYKEAKNFSEDKFEQFLVNWDRYTVVGDPNEKYLVGIKFTKLPENKIISDIFILGVQGIAQPTFEIKVFDIEGKQLKNNFKAMLSRGIKKGTIRTSKVTWDIATNKIPRYFTIDFVQ